MRVVDQDVPSDLFSDYCKSLKPSFQKWKLKFNAFKFNERRFGTGPDIYYARQRSPFRIPHMQDNSLFCPSAAQTKVRRAFRRVLNGYNQLEKYIDYIDEYGIGPPSRSDWYYWAKGQPLWYMNFLISLMWWFSYNFEPAALQRFHLFDDTYCAWGTLGDYYTNYSDEEYLTCGFHFNAEHVVDGWSIIYISKTIRRYKNTLSTLYLHAVNPLFGIEVWRLYYPVIHPASIMTFGTRTAFYKKLATYSLDYVKSEKLIPIFDESDPPDYGSPLYDTIAIRPHFPTGWPEDESDFQGVTFHSKEYKGSTHASLCP